MADAWGKMTGKPGIAFVTRGPGATNASVGTHTAHQDSTPLILFVGQIGRDMAEREAFQEVDYRRMFGEMTKWVAQIDNPCPHPGDGKPCVPRCNVGPPGPGGARTARRHADRTRRCRERPDLPHRAGKSRSCRPRQVPRHALRRRKPAGAGGRWRLDAGCLRRSGGLHRGQSPACRGRFPAPRPDGQPAPKLRRRYRARHQPDAKRPARRHRPADRPRFATWRNRQRRLHLFHIPQAEADYDPYLCRGRRTRQGLSGRSWD